MLSLKKPAFSIFILFALIIVQFASPAGVYAAGTLHVQPSGLTSGTCDSWANACDLQYALGLADSGDELWVKAGTYYPTTEADREITFTLKNGVSVYGGFAGSETLLSQRDPLINITILSGDIGVVSDNSDNSYHVVTGSGTDSSAILDGFTITSGNANNGSIADANNGGGIFNNVGSPTLFNLIISNNISTNLGGGMYNFNSSPTLTNVIFNSNSAVRGAGMFNTDNSSATLTDVTFSNNTASLRGGGISASGSSLSLTNVTFNGNAAQYGGGMQNIYGSNSTLTNVTFYGNSASNSGGAMLIIDNNPTLTNVTISGNTAPAGGGIYNDNTVSSPVITNSIIYGNTGGQISNVNTSLADVTYSVVEGGYTGTGNTSNDPILGPLQNNGGFTSTMALLPGSLAINAGTNTGCPSTDQRGVTRPQDGQCDVGAYEVDNAAPTVTINQAVGQTDPTNASSINFTVVFSEAVTGFDGTDVTLGGTAGAATAVVTGGPTTFNVAVSGMIGDGTVTAAIPASIATDLAGNNNAASTSTDNTVTYDITAPTVTINQAVGQADPTNASPINFTVVFSEAVTGFATGDVSFTGSTVGGTLVGTVSGGPTTYTVAVTGMTTPGDVVATIAANVATDTTGNNNTASTSTDNTVTYDTSGPTVTINQAVGQADPTNASPINFTVVFSEAVTGFDGTDITLGGTAGATTAVVTGGPATYNVAVSGMTGNGTVTASVPAGAALDTSNNPNAASTSTDNSVTYDATVHPTFEDVPGDYWAWPFIERLYNAGITGGCSNNPLNYCPESGVTRAQMAVFLLRGIHGSSYSPPAVGGSTGFVDVPTDYWAAAWIKQLSAEGITGGCGSGNYCPEAPVTRAQMAVFLLRSKHGSTYSPPSVGGSTGFGDVPTDYWAAAWIKQLVAEGITAGCGGGNYCPEDSVTRAQMAVFLVRTFNLP